ncbi:AAA family ATPase [Nakamurella endophytica]|uniref:ATP-binding protein n=1 Tax=Nakamurella endophytica TaxID=1748367 RepID=A0A917WNJ0_9ACTN|nr:AAA family ATPase [Nakamurella endophytica]GGM17182.1 ATP-binding protein [Nakamurella endophytica]
MAEQVALTNTAPRPPRGLVGFQVTKQHRRFVEFADAVRRHRYIGACYGAPGLGKTLSARTYAAADDWDRWATDRYTRGTTLPGSLLASRTLLYTPHVNVTARRLHLEVDIQTYALGADINRALDPDCHPDFDDDALTPSRTELLIVDEADRLKTSALEALRDFFDRSDIGLILIGMPGFDRQLARYPQLYSRIGFAHQYRPLDAEDIPTVLAHYWQQLGHPYDNNDPNHVEAANSVTRITGGNFRLIERLMTQTARVIEINNLDRITPSAVHAARQMLVVGTT